MQCGGGNRGVEQQADLLGRQAHRDEVGQHPPLRVEQRGQSRLLVRPVLKILAELGMKQIGALRPRDTQERELIERTGEQRHERLMVKPPGMGVRLG